MKYDAQLLMTFLEKMYLIRKFEMKVYEFVEKGLAFGSTHLDRSVNNLGAQGIIGASFPISIGAGLVIKLKKLDRILMLPPKG